MGTLLFAFFQINLSHQSHLYIFILPYLLFIQKDGEQTGTDRQGAA